VPSRHHAQHHGKLNIRKLNIAEQQLGKFNQLDQSFEFDKSFEFNNSLQQQLNLKQLNQSGIGKFQHHHNSVRSHWKFANRSFAEYHLAKFHHNAEHNTAARLYDITEHDDHDTGHAAFGLNNLNTGVNNVAKYYLPKFNNFTQHEFAGIEATAGVMVGLG